VIADRPPLWRWTERVLLAVGAVCLAWAGLASVAATHYQITQRAVRASGAEPLTSTTLDVAAPNRGSPI
jgi:hypothetical protein